MTTRREVLCRIGGATSGLLLGIGHLYPAAALLQCLALVPILYFGSDKRIRLRVIMASGMYMGLIYTIPQIAMLRLPIPITLILLAELTTMMILFAWLSAVLLRRSPVFGSLAVGALFVILDWTNYTAVPIWGTAQSFVRCWSHYPYLIQSLSLAGISGISFALGSLESLFVSYLIHTKIRTKIFKTALAEILVLVSVNAFCLFTKPVGSMKVAAIGWCDRDVAEDDIQKDKGFEKFFTAPVIQAAGQGAELAVSGEMGFYIDQFDREKWLVRFKDIARQNNIHLAIGYFNAGENKNRLMFIDNTGQLLCEYTKTNLTPFEDSNRGNGDLQTININGKRVGGMICQDDNFTKLSREYGRMKVGVVAVPTLDWETVKGAHLQNSIHRAIESRYAVVRGAVNGISAIISPTGEVLVKKDHFKEGAGMIIAETDVYETQTVFSKYGNWPVGASAILLFVFVIQNFGRGKRLEDNDKKAA